MDIQCTYCMGSPEFPSRSNWTNTRFGDSYYRYIDDWKSSSEIRREVKLKKIAKRYFQGNSNDGEYLRAKENKILHDAKIRLLPISRQTNKVDGTQQKGKEIGSSHAQDLISTFGEDYLASQGDSFYFFLDVEGIEGQPSLSKEFYLGWYLDCWGYWLLFPMLN